MGIVQEPTRLKVAIRGLGNNLPAGISAKGRDAQARVASRVSGRLFSDWARRFDAHMCCGDARRCIYIHACSYPRLLCPLNHCRTMYCILNKLI